MKNRLNQKFTNNNFKLILENSAIIGPLNPNYFSGRFYLEISKVNKKVEYIENRYLLTEQLIEKVKNIIFINLKKLIRWNKKIEKIRNSKNGLSTIGGGSRLNLYIECFGETINLNESLIKQSNKKLFAKKMQNFILQIKQIIIKAIHENQIKLDTTHPTLKEEITLKRN